MNDSGYCALDKPEYTAKVRWIRRGFQKRVSNYVVIPTTTTKTTTTKTTKMMMIMTMTIMKMMMIFQLYTELPSGNLRPGSEICGCQEGGELKCTMLEEVMTMMMMMTFIFRFL